MFALFLIYSTCICVANFLPALSHDFPLNRDMLNSHVLNTNMNLPEMLVDRSLVEVDVRLYPTSLYTSYVGNTVRAEVAFFATSIAMSRDYIIVGAPGYDNSKGQVLIYKPLDLFHFELVKTLSIPPVGALGSYQFGFGQKVSISSDNVIAIAAGLYDDFRGQVYIYRRDPEDETVWTSQTIVSPLNTADQFGYSLSIDNGFLVVGTLNKNVVFVYSSDSSGVFSLMSTITAPIEQSGSFGSSVAISGGFLAIGAHTADGGNKGLALVYRLVSQSLPSRKLSSPHELGEISFHTLDSIIYTWTLMTIVSANAPYSYFGYSVALHNSTLVVGAPGTIDYLQNSPPIPIDFNGSSYVYELSSTHSSWDLVSVLPSPAGVHSNFGKDVAVHDKSLIIGAPGHGSWQGIAYHYSRTEVGANPSWIRNYTYSSLSDSKGRWGAAVALNNLFFAVGAENHGDQIGKVSFALLSAMQIPTAVPTGSPVRAPLASGKSKFPTFAPTTGAPFTIADVPPPTSQPSSQPSTEPTSFPTRTAAPVDPAGLNFLGSDSKTFPNYALYAVLIFGLLSIIAAAVYCCCKCFPAAVIVAADKKKKEKEDEEDPNVLVIDVHNNDAPDDMLKAKSVQRPGPVSEYGPALISNAVIDDASLSDESSSSSSGSEST